MALFEGWEDFRPEQNTFYRIIEGPSDWDLWLSYRDNDPEQCGQKRFTNVVFKISWDVAEQNEICAEITGMRHQKTASTVTGWNIEGRICWVRSGLPTNLKFDATYDCRRRKGDIRLRY